MNPNRTDGGLASLEFAMFATVLVGALLLVSLAWRLTESRSQVRDAASEGARAASLVQSADTAKAVALRSAATTLAERAVTCSSLDVQVDTSEFKPGGWVGVTVECVARLEDLTLLGVPGSTTMVATAVEIIDVRRGGE